MDSKKNIIIIGVIFLLIILFADFLSQIFPLFKFIDELIPVILGGLLLLKVFRKKFSKKNNKILYNTLIISICLIIVGTIGVLGNLIYDYQSFSSIISDLIVVFKGFVTYVLATFLFTDDVFEENKVLINTIIRGITVAFFILIIINSIYPIYAIEDQRFGISSQKLMFSAPTYLATFGVCLVVLLSRFLGDYKGNFYYIIMANVIIAATLRSKGLMFIAVYIFLFIYLIIKKKKLSKKMILAIGVLSLLVGGAQMFRYLSNPDWARSVLMINSFNVANDHFPLGSGFATFATWESGESYSPVYEHYGIDTIWGIQPDNYSFIGDTYWPAIIGQFGYIGLIFVLIIIFKIYQNISLEKNRFKYFQRLNVLIYLLILSTSETSFMSPVGPILCLLMVI